MVCKEACKSAYVCCERIVLLGERIQIAQHGRGRMGRVVQGPPTRDIGRAKGDVGLDALSLQKCVSVEFA